MGLLVVMLEEELRELPSGASVEMPLAVLEDVFRPSEPDQDAAAQALADQLGLRFEARPDEGVVAFHRDR